MIDIVIFLSILLIIASYISFNLFRKFEIQEKILINYLAYLNKFSKIIEYCDVKIKLVDSKGHFQSDDEVGFFFEELKKMQDMLNEFKIK